LLNYRHFFATLLIIFKVPTKLFWWSNKIIFRSVCSKILDSSTKSFFPFRQVWSSSLQTSKIMFLNFVPFIPFGNSRWSRKSHNKVCYAENKVSLPKIEDRDVRVREKFSAKVTCAIKMFSHAAVKPRLWEWSPILALRKCKYTCLGNNGIRSIEQQVKNAQEFVRGAYTLFSREFICNKQSRKRKNIKMMGGFILLFLREKKKKNMRLQLSAAKIYLW